ncbi:PAS domain S-box protein [bacterium]|nr:PAS domain S-box protein [bacterium]
MAKHIEGKVFSNVQEPFKLLAQASHEAIAIHDQGTIIIANSAFYQLFGYKHEELVGQSISILTTPPNRKALLERVKKRGEGTFPGLGLRKDGTVLYGEIRANNLETDEGEFRVVTIRDLTDQILAKQELAEKDNRLKLALSVSGLGTFDWYPQNNELFWDERMHDIFNLDLLDSRNRNDYFFSVLHPEDREGVQEKFNQVLSPDSSENEFENNYRIILADNQLKYIYTKGILTRSPNGEVERLTGICRDDSKQKQSQFDLEESELRYRRVVEDQTEMIIRWNPDGIRTFVNDAYCKMFQKPQKELIGTNFYDLIHKKNIPNLRKRIKKLTPDSPIITETHQVLLPGDKTGYQEWTERAFFDNTGKVIEYQSVGRDITKRIQAQLRLKENEELLSLIYNSSQEFMALIKVEKNAPFKVVSVNKRILELSQRFGESEVEFGLEGVPLKGFLIEKLKFYPETVESLLNYCQQIRTTKQPLNYENDHEFSNGERISVAISLSPILNDENECIHILYSSWNTTHVKQARDQVLLAVIETEDRERKRIAKEIHDSLGQNLTTASMNLKMAKKYIQTLPPFIQKGYSAGLRSLNQAIEESRSISYNLMPKAIDDFGYILAVESMFANIQSAINLEIIFYDNLKGERLDKKMERSLYRITQEAANNVLKHADAATLTLQLMKYPDQITLMIEDDGVGFDPLQTASTLPSMGLNNMKTRAQALSGTLTIDSTAGKGTVIMVQIPTNSGK